MFKNLSVATLLIAGASAQYQNASNIPWALDLDCTSCVRAGFDYCIYDIGGVGT
jgi:hypothetical protein